MRLRDLRQSQGLSQKVIADYLGCSTVVYSRYETGSREPSMDTLTRLADYFNVSIDYLTGKSDIPRNGGVVRIPVVGHVVAGIPTSAIEDIIDWEEIDEEMARRGDYIGLRVKGDSMYPEIKDGDIAIIRRQDTIETGDIAVVFVNGDEATIKKIKKMDDGIMLIGFNTAVYEPHFYNRDEIADLPVKIYGKLVEVRRKF
ncbi:MAG: LexA family protein [Candidatus Ventricola sp.]